AQVRAKIARPLLRLARFSSFGVARRAYFVIRAFLSFAVGRMVPQTLPSRAVTSLFLNATICRARNGDRSDVGTCFFSIASSSTKAKLGREASVPTASAFSAGLSFA